MKSLMKSLLPSLAIAIAATLVSFDMRPGSHSFQILLDNKMVIERYDDRNMKAQTIQLTSENKTLDVRYNECGRTVSGRALTAKDNNDKVLKVWRFEGSTSGFKDAMSCDVKELRSLALSHSNAVRIFYTSNDFPDGLHIFTASAENHTVVSGN